LVERQLPKLNVAGSSPVVRSNLKGYTRRHYRTSPFATVITVMHARDGSDVYPVFVCLETLQGSDASRLKNLMVDSLLFGGEYFRQQFL
jgi:hypothetical protein